MARIAIRFGRRVGTMSVIVEATIPADQFVLKDALSSVPGAEFEFMRLVADGSTHESFVWAAADDCDQLTGALEACATTESVECLAALPDTYLYRFEWGSPFRAVFSLLSDSEGTLLSGYGTADGWELCMLFSEHAAVSATHDACEDYGLDLSVQGVFQLSNVRRLGRSSLTGKQREALVAAHDAGYYSVPRQTSLQELADRQRISHQALSELLRRGHRELIRSAIGAATGGVDRDGARVVGKPTPYSQSRLIRTEL